MLINIIKFAFIIQFATFIQLHQVSIIHIFNNFVILTKMENKMVCININKLY